MKIVSMILAAVAMVLGLSQCTKEKQPKTMEGEVPITLSVRANNGTRIDVNTGAVAFEYGDVVYVANGGKYVGTLTCNGSGSFAGSLHNPTLNEPLYFYLLGNQATEETLENGISTTCSVVISDQTEKLPVVSLAESDEPFTGSGNYIAYFYNKAALVKFDVTSPSTSPVCLVGMNNKVTVDFTDNSFSFSQEGEGYIMLPAGSGERWAILLPQASMASAEAHTQDFAYTGTCGHIPPIWENDYLTDGIEVNVTTVVPVNGKFTVNANGDQVYFSQGNLQYQASTNTWQFAEHQYDYVGSDNSNISQTYSGWIDLFGWGTSGWDCGNTCYHPWDNRYSIYNNYGYLFGPPGNYNLTGNYANSDWGYYNPIINGGNTTHQWRTLTHEEWAYVFDTRNTSSGIRFARAQVAGVNGVILLPDDWSTSYYSLSFANIGVASFNNNVISSSDWANGLQSHGAVFLPGAGYRRGTSVYFDGTYGYYWSASSYNSSSAYSVGFTTIDTYIDHYIGRCEGHSVRLVQDNNP